MSAWNASAGAIDPWAQRMAVRCRLVQDGYGPGCLASRQRTGICPRPAPPRGRSVMARELIYTGFMSLDGVADSPGGQGGRASKRRLGDGDRVRPGGVRPQERGARRHDGAHVREAQLEVFAPSRTTPRTTRHTRTCQSTSSRRPSPMPISSTDGARPRSCDPATTSPS